MNEINEKNTSRRDFLKGTGRIAAASAFAGIAPRIYAGQSNTIKVALIGCGGRGTGAAENALSVNQGPIKLVAMGDVFANRLANSHKNLLNDGYGDRMDVPEDRKFIGFDAYKKAMDCLSPGDIAIFATPPAFRWVHFTYAIQKGLNVFMEKPVTVDGPTSRRMFKLAEESKAKNLKVGVGLMSRHSRALEELAKRIQDGEIGDVILQRGYRMSGPIGFFRSLPKPPGISDLLYQVQRFHSFIWASGGCFSDFYIHIIDHQCWMKNDWPVKAQALGGRHYKTSPEGVAYVDQNFDTYSVEYTFGDGSKFFMDGRCMEGCKDIYCSFAHGSKGVAIVSKSGDCGLPSSIHKGQDPTRENMIWESKIPRDEHDPYQNEWNDLVDAIRNDKPYNEVERGVKGSLVTSLGRMAAHTGQEITYEQILNSDHEMAPGLDKLTMDSPAPLQPDSEGRYPVPEPGIVKDREYKNFA
jgi:predicted dehydrogenase